MIIRPHKEDIIVVGHYLGSVLSLVALAMCVPLATSIIFREFTQTPIFLMSAAVTAIIGIGLRLSTFKHARLGLRNATIVTALAWMGVSLLGAIPLALSGHYPTFLDAVFEAASGITTTGLTTVVDLEHMSLSMNCWRFVLALTGGQGVLIAGVALGIFGRDTTVGAQNTSMGEETDSLEPTVRSTSRTIWVFSAIVVLVSAIAIIFMLLMKGLSPISAGNQGLWLAIAAFHTTGFTPHATSIMYYHSWALEIVLMVFMLMGALSLVIYADIARGDKTEVFRNAEVKIFFVWGAALAIICMLSLATGNNFSTLPSLLRRGVFTLVSAMTTSGFSNLDPTQMRVLFASGALFTIMLAMGIGGGAGSTSGGIKALRMGIIVKSVMQRIKEMLLPDSAVSHAHIHYVHQRRLTPEIVTATYVITIFFILAYIFGTIFGIMAGYEATEAAFESFSAASNTGLSAGLISASTPAFLKVVYIVEMIAGRLEFITLFAVLVALLAPLSPGPLFHRLAHRAKSKRSGKRSAMFVALPLVLALVAGAPLATPALADENDGVDSVETIVEQAEVAEESVEATEVTVADLKDVRNVSSDTLVVVSGEVVGDIIDGDDREHKWISIQDGNAVISVYVTAEQAAEIENLGAYRTTGDTVTVTGIYHSDCTDGHQGELDVHASDVEVVAEGGERGIPATPDGFWAMSLILTVVAMALLFVYEDKKRRRRHHTA